MERFELNVIVKDTRGNSPDSPPTLSAMGELKTNLNNPNIPINSPKSSDHIRSP